MKAPEQLPPPAVPVSTREPLPAPRQSYWEASRAHRYSLIFALPLLLAYEALALLLANGAAGGGMRNGADVLLQQLVYSVAGPYEPIVFGGLLVGGSLWLIGRDAWRHGQWLRMSVFFGMLLESMVLAVVFGIVVGTLTAQLVGAMSVLALGPVDAMDPLTRLMISLGAGLYEELLFRVVLVTALAFGARMLFGWRPAVAGTFAVIVGALVFSAFHYIGPYGDELRLDSFVFRAVGGVFFSALYLLRGFGITAWTHALYDVLVLFIV